MPAACPGRMNLSSVHISMTMKTPMRSRKSGRRMRSMTPPLAALHERIAAGSAIECLSHCSRVLFPAFLTGNKSPDHSRHATLGAAQSLRSLMGHRLSKIYTRTGDGGETGLGDGSRTRKDSPRVVALGEIDELNSAIGVLLAEPVPEKIRAILESVQHDLFDLGGDVSIPGRATMTEDQVKRLEVVPDELNSALPRLKEFILPGGTRAASLAHLARTVCRRAERSIVALSSAEKVADPARVYLNRLSDLLFVLGRVLNREGGRGDVLWQQGKNR